MRQALYDEPVSDAEKPSSPWYRWPAEWSRDEKFWRDVGSRTLAGIIVVFVAWLGAIAFGYLQKPEFVHNLGNVLMILALIGIVLSIPAQISHALRLRRVKDEQWRIWAWSVALDIPAIFALGYFGLSTWEYVP